MTTIASRVHMMDTVFVQVLWMQMPNVTTLCKSSWSMQALHLQVCVGVAVHQHSQLTCCWHALVSQCRLDEALGP